MQSTTFSRQGQEPSRSSNNIMDDHEQLKATLYSPGIIPQALFQPPVPSSTTNNTRASHKVRDELYDVTEDEDSDTEVVPFRISNSIKRAMEGPPTTRISRRRPSIMIPPPSSWPNVQKAQKDGELTPLAQPRSPLSPAALAKLAIFHNDPLPGRSETPSLADSLTSADEGSCISTPNTQNHEDSEGGLWDAPIRLNPLALNALNHIRTGLDVTLDEDVAAVEHVVEIPEMQDRGLAMNTLFANSPGSDDREPMSAISLPSPGGFASLSSAINTFGLRSPNSSAPNTSTAENFYGVPWRDALPAIVETVEDGDEDREEASTSTPPTTNQTSTRASILLSPFRFDDSQETPRAAEFGTITQPTHDYDRDYEDKLRKDAEANMRRTSTWLSAQETYLSAFKGCIVPAPEIATDGQNTPPTGSPVLDADSPSSTYPPRSSSLSSDHGPLFDDAFKHLLDTSSSQDAFIQRRARADAIQTQRLYLPEKHVAQLSGNYSIHKHPSKSSNWLDASSKTEEQEAEDRRAEVARANIEQQALQQIQMSFWEQEAARFIMGGSLIHRAAARQLRKQASLSASTQILDLGGQATAGWGWMAAYKYPNSKVYTAVSASNISGTCSEASVQNGPSNHSTITVSNSWTLPFADNSFTLVSVGSLHALLRTSKPSQSPELKQSVANGDRVCSEDQSDEYEATLSEIHRVLAPGGFVQFQVLDAEISGHSGSALVSKSVEFAVALRSQNYDPSASTHFVERLQKAGFSDVNRTWMKLPLGSQKPRTKDPNEAQATEDLSKMSTPTGSTFTVESTEAPSIDSMLKAPEQPDVRRRLGWTKGNVLQKMAKSPRKRPPPTKPLPSLTLAESSQATSPAFTMEPLHTPSTVASPREAASELHERAEVEDVGIESLTGMLGSISWERWMLKLHSEIGKPESQMLEGVAQALEEARTSGTSAAWTMLIGCAMKKA